MKHTISVLVENKAGVLSRVSGLFSRRGFNIDSLAVGVTEREDVSKITIVVDGDDYIVEQVEKQLNKTIDVIKVRRMEDGHYVSCGLTLFKIHAQPARRGEIMNTAQLLNLRILYAGQKTMVLASCENAEQTRHIESMLRPYGIMEIARTGAVAMETAGE